MVRSDAPDLSRTLGVILAGGCATRLHELTLRESKAALPIGGRRLVDFAAHAAVCAGLGRLRVVLPAETGSLARHWADAWGHARATLDGGPHYDPGTAGALRAALEAEPGAEEVVVLPADQVHGLDLADLVATHRQACAAITHVAGPGAGPLLADRAALLDRLRRVPDGADLWADALGGAGPDVAAAAVPEGAYWRDVDTLDDVHAVSLDFAGPATPCAAPPVGAVPASSDDGRSLAIAAGGLTLTVPRFGARTPGRWTLLEDTVVMPGARVGPGARLTRALIAPGAVVPAGLVVGEDPDEDARWFRVTPLGVTLITAPMLAARAAERMRAQTGARLPGLATSGPN